MPDPHAEARHIAVMDTTLRDGEQTPDVSYTPGEKLQQLLDRHINPSLAAHGGYAELVKMEDTVAHILMGGGCQGCAMAEVTLRQGVEPLLREALPDARAVVDVTDHAAGASPYFRTRKGPA